MAVPSTPSAVAKHADYESHYEQLERHKIKMAEGERKLDEWNKSKTLKIYQYSIHVP